MSCRVLAAGLVLLILALPQSAAATPTWLAPKNFSVSGNGGDLNVRVDAAGDAFVVWARSGTVQAAQRPAGGTWSAAQNISGGCIAPQAVQLAVSPGGAAVAVWECPKGGNVIVQASTRARGGSWSPPHDLSQAGQDAHAPQVALDRTGDALAVWARSNGTDVIVQAAFRRGERRLASRRKRLGSGSRRRPPGRCPRRRRQRRRGLAELRRRFQLDHPSGHAHVRGLLEHASIALVPRLCGAAARGRRFRRRGRRGLVVPFCER